ncbi:MAG: hypothetical protein ACQEW5_28430 [Bacillota bacterium]
MTLYAVCFSEDVQDSKIISVVEASTEKDALRYHTRRIALTEGEIIRNHIFDFSTDGFFHSNFIKTIISSEEEFDQQWEEALEEVRKSFSNPIVGDFYEKAYNVMKESNFERELSEEEVPDEVFIEVADWLVENDVPEQGFSYLGDAVIVEVKEIAKI